MTIQSPVLAIAAAAKGASTALRSTTSTQRNDLLHSIAEALVANAESIVEANAKDVAAGQANGMTPGLLDRLTLTPERLCPDCGVPVVNTARRCDDDRTGHTRRYDAARKQRERRDAA